MNELNENWNWWRDSIAGHRLRQGTRLFGIFASVIVGSTVLQLLLWMLGFESLGARLTVGIIAGGTMAYLWIKHVLNAVKQLDEEYISILKRSPHTEPEKEIS
jgi:hypothetical protein